MEFSLVRLDAGSAAEFREIRLEGLHHNPINFASAYEVECEWPLSAFAERLESSLHVGAYIPLTKSQNYLIGIANLVAQVPARMRHKADITSVYVRPAYQGKGVAKAMFAWLEMQAARQFDQVHLSVLAANTDAVRLYEHLGYRAYGTEPRATKYNGQYFDDVFMVKFLR